MSTITQRIPNLLLGISQQPDDRKIPGQVRDAVNVYPDYALGLLKRPGGKFNNKLVGATPEGRWFSILRDENEKYVGQFDDNVFRIWSLLDGSPRAVNMGSNTGVPGTCNIVNLKADLVTYNAAVSDTKAKLELLHAAQATYSEVLAGQNATYVELFQVSYNYPVGAIDEYLVSGIALNSNGIYLVKNNNSVISTSSTLPSGYTVASEVTDEHPLFASQGYRLFVGSLEVAATHNAGQLATALSNMNTAQTNYDNAVIAEAAAKTNYDAEVSNCAIAAIPSNGYLKDATPEDIELLTLNDYTFVLNKKKEVKMTANLTATLPHQAFVVLKVVGTGHYKIYLDGTERATHNTGSGGDADSILNDLAGDINGQTFGGKTYTAVRIGAGIYISATAAFSISVLGGPSEEALVVFQDSIPSTSNLPVQCKDGYKVRVVNSNDIDVDDMWVQFNTDSGSAYGVGVWEESNAPGITYEFDPLTMPHQLVRQADGSFTFGPVTWEDRIVGDLTTNPNPSFVDSTISSIFFYRNRLGFTSNESVILSRSGDYFNFWATTALTVTDDDPIDIATSTVRPTFLHYVNPTSTGLVLFGEQQQFFLTTDSDILSPKTAKINTLSSYNASKNVEALSLGTTIAFVSKSTLYTNLFELYEISNSTTPFLYEQTKIVPELVPSTIDSLIGSADLSLISLGTKGDSTVYQYRFFQQGDRRLISTWYKWELTGKLLDQFFDSNSQYITITDNTNVYTVSLELTQADEEGLLTLPTGERTDVCLDMWDVNPYRTYNSATDTTRIFLPYDTFGSSSLSVLVLGGYIGAANGISDQSVGALLSPTVQGSAGAYYADISGDYRGRNLIIGYNYTMEVDLPKLYLTRQEGDSVISDTSADLILHRIKVSTGLSGPIKYRINITGIPQWDNVVEVTQPYNYVLNNVNLSADAVHDVPLYQRNKNLLIKIIGDTPFPVSILNLNWEGKYGTRFYKRV